jgi:hypothetical protein
MGGFRGGRVSHVGRIRNGRLKEESGVSKTLESGIDSGFEGKENRAAMMDNGTESIAGAGCQCCQCLVEPLSARESAEM